MLNEICAEIKNYFTLKNDKHIGDFKIVDGHITPSFDIADGQYFRIVGSVFNDGVHLAGDYLIDEPKFHGAVWLMRVPEDIKALAEEIEEWQGANAQLLNGPYTSESFGGYSYTIASTANGKRGLSWKDQENFSSRLNKYRRIRVN